MTENQINSIKNKRWQALGLVILIGVIVLAGVVYAALGDYVTSFPTTDVATGNLTLSNYGATTVGNMLYFSQYSDDKIYIFWQNGTFNNSWAYNNGFTVVTGITYDPTTTWLWLDSETTLNNGQIVRYNVSTGKPDGIGNISTKIASYSGPLASDTNNIYMAEETDKKIWIFKKDMTANSSWDYSPYGTPYGMTLYGEYLYINNATSIGVFNKTSGAFNSSFLKNAGNSATSNSIAMNGSYIWDYDKTADRVYVYVGPGETGGGGSETLTFSNYYDDTQSLYLSGTGHFNVTVHSTNGTVILHINGTNIVASNISAYVFNATATFAQSGTYSYNWTSYQNVSGTLYTSNQRDYIVNSTPVTQTNVSVCGSLSIAGMYYTLNQNITATGTCITVGADNITLDGKGYTITYGTSGGGAGTDGVYSNLVDNITVKHCKIFQGGSANDNYGINYVSSDNGTIYNNSITTGGTEALPMEIVTSLYTNISSNTIITHGTLGYTEIWHSNYTNFENNIINTDGSRGDAFIPDNSAFITVDRNIITTSGEEAFGISVVDASMYSTFTNNVIHTSGPNSAGIQIWFFNPKHLTFVNNSVTANGTTADGIHIGYIPAPSAGHTATQSVDDIKFYNMTVYVTGYPMAVAGNNASTSGEFASINFSIYNSILNSSVTNQTYNMQLVQSGQFNFTNVTNKVGNILTFSWDGDKGTLNRMWYLAINVSNATAVLQNANVTLRDSSGVFDYSELTPATGTTSLHTILEYRNINNTLITYLAPHNITTNLTGYQNNITTINLTTLKNQYAYKIIMQPYGATDITPPYFTTIPANQTINYTQGFKVHYVATDETGLSSYKINWTTLFTINSTGDLVNSTPNLAVGTYVINVSINDTSNNINYTIYKLIVNKSIPNGTLTSSLGWNINASQTVTIGYSDNNPGDADLTYIVYRDGISKGTGETWTPSIGSYNYVLNTTGGANWTINSSIYAKTLNVIDSTLPSMHITYPINGTVYTININTLNYTYMGNNPGFCWYTKNAGKTNSSIVGMGTNFTGIASFTGSNNWTLWCNDSSNHLNSTSVSFNMTSFAGWDGNGTVCYQESANESNGCGGLNTGTYSLSDNSVDGYFFINYTKPAGVTYAVWQAKYGSTSINYMYSNDNSNFTTCWNSIADKVVLRIFSQNSFGASNSITYAQCYNGATWLNIGPSFTGSYAGPGGICTNQMWDGVWNSTSECLHTTGGSFGWSSSGPTQAQIWEEAITWVTNEMSHVDLISPANNYQFADYVTFNCSAKVIGGAQLSNISLYTNITGAWDVTNFTSIGGYNNSVTFTNYFPAGKYLWGCYACDTNGQCGFSGINRTINSFTFTTITATYDNQVFENNLEDFNYNFSYASSIYTLANVYLIYNGTSYLTDSSGSSGIGTSDYELSIPTVPFSGTNYSFYWSVGLTNSSGTFYFSSDSYNQTINKGTSIVGNSTTCPAGFYAGLNFTSYDEASRIAINFTKINYYITYGLSGNNSANILNTSISNIPSFAICINNSQTYYDIGYGEIQYSIDGFSPRRYYIFSGTHITNTTTNIPVYSLNSTLSTSFLITAETTSLNPYINYYVGLLRWYPEINSYQTVELGKTDDKGQTVLHVNTENVDYRFAVYDSHGNLVKIFSPSRLVCQTTPCVYTLYVDTNPLDLTTWGNIESSLTFNKTSMQFTYIWNDPSQATQTLNLSVWHDGTVSSELICSTSSTGYTGVMICDVTGFTGTLRAEVTRHASPTVPIAQDIENVASTLIDAGGGALGLFVGALLLILFAFIGVASPVLVVILAIVALIPLFFLGSIPAAVMMGIGVLGGIILHTLRRNT